MPALSGVWYQHLNPIPMKKNHFMLIVTVLLAHVCIAQEGFHLIKKTVIGGEGGWDYLSVDSKNNTLYLSHATQVEVLDLKTHEK